VVEEFQLVAQVQPVSLAEIQVGADGPGSLQPGLSDGSRIQARRLVIATGPGEPVLPSWVHRIAGSYPIEAMQHSQAIDLAACGGLQGQHILLVGGGLSSAHLALGAIRRGARVSLLCRRDLRWPGTTVHLMGGLAALQLGPAARNLFGGREAAHRICRTAIKT
jgi:glycine/D-amino acid oxidase-like deaminating enzyme